MTPMLDKLRSLVQSPSKITPKPPLEPEAIEAISSAPAPVDGSVHWHLPPSYRSFLTEAGRFSLEWFSPALDRNRSIVLFDADGIAEASEIVYVPNDVDLGNGAVSTNHLVPFAGEPGGEWAFCFDASTPGPEYPVYYHHQDRPRAKLLAGGWDPSSEAAPEWESFGAWIEWLVRALGAGADPEVIGQPYPKRLLRLG
jgi:hypothetical protein